MACYLFIELTLGMFSGVQMLSARSRSRISHANIVGFSCLYLIIESTTDGVATFGFEPPITPGLIEPVSKYLQSHNARDGSLSLLYGGHLSSVSPAG